MHRIFFVTFLLIIQVVACAPKKWVVTSPDKSLQLVLTNNKEGLRYQVVSGDTLIVQPSALGINVNGNLMANRLSFVKATSKVVKDQYQLLIGKQKTNNAEATETSVLFKGNNNMLLQIDVRAYNDGVAFRYSLPQEGKTVTITDEQTQFSIPTNGKVWLENYDLPTDYTPAYEGIYENGIAIGTHAKDSGGWALPALFQTAGHWLLLAESNLGRNYFGVRLDSNCSNGVYRLALPMQSEAKGMYVNYAKTETPFSTPWRVIMVGKSLGTIVESNLVYHLAEPNKLGDVSWVKPGRSSWSWWGDHNSSKDFEKLKKFVDLAKEMGWEYSLVDANWNIMQGGDIQELVKYAASQNIGLLLWYNSGGPHNVVTEQPRDVMHDPVKRRAEFQKLRQWGIKGIKVDFFQSDKQTIIQQYHDILMDAAKEKLIVNFHGCTIPRGWSRTYPNLVTMEAVRGAENYGWGKQYAQTAATHNNIITYTRNVIGPMDYTPVTFSDYDCCPHTTTNAHELALSVLFESGIQHFADRAAPYQNLDEKIKSFLKSVPVTWDETKWIQGEPGKETVLARRDGNKWYIAGSNGENLPKTINVQLPFLNEPSYHSVTFYDGSNAREIRTDEGKFKKGETLTIGMLPSGGFVMVVTPDN